MQKTMGELSRAFDRIAAVRRVSLWHVFAEQGLHFGQLRILEHIIKNERCTQSDIAEKLDVSPASIALSTKRLQKTGMIKKAEDNNNRRCNILTVTEKGHETVVECRRELDLFDEKMFAGTSGEERLFLTNILERLLKNCTSDKVDVYKLMHDMHSEKGRKKC